MLLRLFRQWNPFRESQYLNNTIAIFIICCDAEAANVLKGKRIGVEGVIPTVALGSEVEIIVNESSTPGFNRQKRLGTEYLATFRLDFNMGHVITRIGMEDHIEFQGFSYLAFRPDHGSKCVDRFCIFELHIRKSTTRLL